MLRRLLLVSLVAAVAACGSGASTASPAASPASSQATPAPTNAAATAGPATSGPSTEPNVAPSATSMIAACNAVGIRQLPTTKGALVVRIGMGTTVNVVETVPGEAYASGACGAAGDAWLKIDQIGGRSVQTLYGVSPLYAAAGFFR